MKMEKSPQKLDRRVAKTQKSIRDAFRTLIVRDGLNKVTVSALAREADIDRKTFYLHYSSIDNLIAKEAAILVERIAHAMVETDSAERKPFPLRLKSALTELANITAENPELYRCLFKSYSLTQMVDALIGPARKAAMETEQVFTTDNEEAVEFILRFCLSGALSVFIHWFMQDSDTPIETVVDIVEQATASNPALLVNG